MRRKRSFAKVREIVELVTDEELTNHEAESILLSGRSTLMVGRGGDVSTIARAMQLACYGATIIVIPEHTENFS